MMQTPFPADIVPARPRPATGSYVVPMMGAPREMAEVPIAERRPALVIEARQWSIRHIRAEVLARKFSSEPLLLRRDRAEVLSSRAQRRAVRIRLRFHRALDRLVVAGGFAEARTILGERQQFLSELEGGVEHASA